MLQWPKVQSPTVSALNSGSNDASLKPGLSHCAMLLDKILNPRCAVLSMCTRTCCKNCHKRPNNVMAQKQFLNKGKIMIITLVYQYMSIVHHSQCLSLHTRTVLIGNMLWYVCTCLYHSPFLNHQYLCSLKCQSSQTTHLSGCHLFGGCTKILRGIFNFFCQFLDDGIDSAWTAATKNMSPHELNRWRRTLFSIYVGHLPYDITKVILKGF